MNCFFTKREQTKLILLWYVEYFEDLSICFSSHATHIHKVSVLLVGEHFISLWIRTKSETCRQVQRSCWFWIFFSYCNKEHNFSLRVFSYFMWRSPLLLPQSNTRPHGYRRTQILAAVVFIPESCGMTKIFLFICEFLSLVAEVTQFRSRINLGLLCTRIARENVCYLSTRI